MPSQPAPQSRALRHHRHMSSEHHYSVDVLWRGNLGQGTTDYTSYSRAHEVRSASAPMLSGSADPAYRGEPDRWNPEQLLVVSLSQCHMLWVLSLASQSDIVIVAYRDHAQGVLRVNEDGSGQLSHVTLRPEVVVADPEMVDLVRGVHRRAHRLCFIARSVNFEVLVEPTTLADRRRAGR